MASNPNASNLQKSQQPATADDIAKIKKLCEEQKFCMLTTQDASGQLRSRPMGLSGEVETSGNSATINFFTYKESDKLKEMHAHHDQINLAFSDPKRSSYVSLSGTGRVTEDRAELEKRWSVAMKAWFPDGLETKGISLLQVHVDKAEYWDAPSSTVAHAIAFVKSQVTGKVPDPADHKKVELA